MAAQDIALLHPETAHAGGPNYSATIRSMVYFRLKSADLSRGGGTAAEDAALKDAYISDMWADFKGLPKEQPQVGSYFGEP